jgi:putative ABC transport system permease protein
VLSAVLFGVSPVDPVAVAGATLLLAGVASVASWIPAHRASALDPAQALRTD